MHVKVTSSGSRQYVQLVESFRDPDGKVKKRTVATLGRLDQIAGDLDSVVRGLLKVSGKSVDALDTPSIQFDPARAFGDLWALNELWNTLGFSGLRKIFRTTRHSIPIEACIRAMVFNRLCDPESKLGVLRWLETVAMPDMPSEGIIHQHLLRSMDALIDHQAEVDAVTATLLRPLIDQDLSIVFYDLTTIRAEGLSQQQGDHRQFGMSKEGIVARQFMLGVVQTADGLPIYHEVFDGNTAETKTLLPTVETVLGRFPSIKRLILVADRGLLSLENLESLKAMKLGSGHPLEFIIAVPGRRYSEFAELLEGFHAQECVDPEKESIGEREWQDLRLIIAHDPARAKEQQEKRQQSINELTKMADEWTGKLDSQDEGKAFRGRKLSDSGAKARFYHAVCDAHLARIIRVDLKSELFTYDIDEKALGLAKQNDGKLLLITNAQDLSPQEVIDRYKSLADIERGFRALKSELEIGPVHHRLPERIRAHAAICFMALILYRVMRMRLRASESSLSPERALEVLRRVQRHQIRLDNAPDPVTGISTMTLEQTALFKALKIKKPLSAQA
jgi:transposase